MTHPLTDSNHPITPPPELVEQWATEHYVSKMGDQRDAVRYIAAKAADWQLEQVIEFIAKEDTVYADYIKQAMRPQEES